MRDLDEHRDDAPPLAGELAGGPRTVVSTVAGAVLCVGLVAGGAWWFAGAGEHTARELPVFRAELGPAKVRPEDPGGAETPYRDIRSYDVAAGSGDEPEPEIALAPAPADPAAEDLAMAELEPAPGAVLLDGGESARAGLALTEAEAPGEQAAATVGPDSAAPAATPPVPERPREPAGPSASGAQAPGQGQTASQEEIDRAVRLAARAALSRVQIQLGAFTDRAYTEAEWRRIADTNADLLDGLALAIQPTTSGGTKFYRLRVGPFDDRSQASRVCEALKARGQDCLVAENS